MQVAQAGAARPMKALPAAEAAEADALRRLEKIIRERSLLTGEFTLSSGRKSNYLFQLRQTTMHPQGASLIGELIVRFMRRHGLTCVGGPAVGAVPIVAATAAKSHDLDYPVSAFFVRKEPKAHGAREQIDGYVEQGGEALFVDDVTTSGGSVWRAIEAVSGHDCTVKHVLTIVDREEGAAEFLKEKGITLHAFFTKSAFRDVLSA